MAAGEQITEESFVAYLVRERKLNDEEIISSLTEMFSAAIDTVSRYLQGHSSLTPYICVFVYEL